MYEEISIGNNAKDTDRVPKKFPLIIKSYQLFCNITVLPMYIHSRPASWILPFYRAIFLPGWEMAFFLRVTLVNLL